ncbi:MAG: histone deacetylase [Rhizobiaceae bacterium]|nr:histone deacetylase [Rhizobiaceae bacterium]MCV0405910.1 histone deacetylase [Rhizobiaceae bacterium]
MTLPIVHHPDYDARFPAGHRFPMGKYSQLMTRLRAKGLANGTEILVPEPASSDWLKRVHDSDYVDHVIACTVPKEIEKEIGFAVDQRVSARARYATAGTVLAARLALRHGVACNTAGGSHHARRAQGAGFCTLNDAAVAAARLLEDGAASRVLIVDLDVHQGDGTADIFAREPRVFTFSMHAEKNYPARKIQSDLDVELPDGTGDDAYLARLASVLPVLMSYARPDLVIYNAGVDPHQDDQIGRLKLTDEGLRQRDRTVFAFFRERGVPVCGVIGGGYSKDIAALAERHTILFEVAAQFT